MDSIQALEKAFSPHMQNIAWGTTRRAEADFRSDVLTTPSMGMLAAMIGASLGDDVFKEDQVTNEFQSVMASQCGLEAGAFVISGTMANQLAIRTLLTQPPCGVLVDARAHVIHFEGGGVGMSGASIQTARPSNGRYMVLEDIISRAIVTEDVHKCPTRVISIENTAGGSVIPVEELRRISEWAHSKDIKVHMDGARLWEAVAAGGGSLYDYGTQVWLNIEQAGITAERWNQLGAKHGVKLDGKRLVLHHQISSDAITKLGLVFSEALGVRARL